MYEITVAVNVGIFILLALSINIITGYAGQPNIGHAAFFGIGAYSSAVLSTKLGLNFFIALPLSGIIAGLLGMTLGIISIRVQDDFLATTTIGINFIVIAIFRYLPIFGASFGMAVPTPKILGTEFNNLYFLFLVIALACLIILLHKRIENSWFGMALGGIRNNENAAESIGINVKKFKIAAFTIGTFFAGIAGSIYAHFMTFITAEDFAFEISTTILSMAVVGGLGTIQGPILGALLLGVAPEVFRFVAEYSLLIYGGLLVLMMRFQPHGLLGKNSYILNNISIFMHKKELAGRSGDDT